MKKRFIILLIVAGFFLVAASAQALPMLSISGGTQGIIPSGSTNDLLNSIYGTSTREGVYGGQIYLNQASKVEFTFLGFEAAWENEFWVDNGSGYTQLFSTETNVSSWGNYETGNLGSVVLDLGAGWIDFKFTSYDEFDTDNDSIYNYSVANGSNPDDSGTNFAGINFFSSIDGLVAGTPYPTIGRSLMVFLDDSGAGPDDNHDDMAIRISAVSEPATMFLLGASLFGIAIVSRRKFK